MASFKMTRAEKKWVMYDIGNSAFVLLNTAIVPIYLNALLEMAGKENLVVSWGYAQTIASLVVAILMPILGSLADYRGKKVKFFTGFMFTGLLCCFALSLPLSWFAFLAIYVFATIGLNSSMCFYDAMLPDITTDDRMDNVSSAGYAWGYIGSCIPFIACIVLIFVGPSFLPIDTLQATRMTFIITGLWWLFFTIPLLRSYEQKFYKEQEPGAIANTFKNLWATCKKIASNKPLFIFMVAFFFYIDGVHTVISMATSYGADLGIDSTQLVLALLVTQFVAFPSAIIYGRLAGKHGTLRMIMIAVLAYVCCVMFAAFFLRSAVEFWILAVIVGMFQGGVQALSRSYFGTLIPKDHATEYYGFFDIFGRYASVCGTLLVSIVTQLSGNSSLGVLSIGILLVIGFVMLVKLSNIQKVTQLNEE